MRKVIQISAVSGYDGPDASGKGGCYALCDDGSVFFLNDDEDVWEEVPPIPQPKVVMANKSESDASCKP